MDWYVELALGVVIVAAITCAWLSGWYFGRVAGRREMRRILSSRDFWA